VDARERLLRILADRPADRPAVLCPGGMMSLAVTEVMAASGAAWPAAHCDEQAMLRLALAMQEAAGFDNLALPFCMTVEAEAYGAAVDMGDALTQPKVKGALLPPDGSGELPRPDFERGRAAVVLRAMSAARSLRPDLPIVGNLVGPLSLLGMLADPLRMLRWTRRAPDALRRHLESVSSALVMFGRLQMAAGADAVCIAEPTATGEILGATQFRSFALPYLNQVAGALREAGLPAVVHICGDVRGVRRELDALAADAVSFDSMVDIVALSRERPRWRVMGNVSAFLLEAGPPEAVRQRCRLLLEGGVKLLAPACGVIPTTPVGHLRAMRESVSCDG
jgi:[methyl-Co(III) methanol-specific corrinoid protein]:coenzyme M methyltransferase